MHVYIEMIVNAVPDFKVTADKKKNACEGVTSGPKVHGGHVSAACRLLILTGDRKSACGKKVQKQKH